VGSIFVSQSVGPLVQISVRRAASLTNFLRGFSELLQANAVVVTFFLVSLGGVRLSPLGTSATVSLLYQPRMIDDDYGAVGE
jgi:hypothetical protein